MTFLFDPASLSQTLLMTLKGMVGIFLVIGVIMLVIFLLNRLLPAEKKPAEDSQKQ